MLSVRLPEDIEKRLNALAEATGRAKSYYVREAILDKIDDMEAVYIAESRLEDVRSGRSKVLTSSEFWNDLDD